MHPLFHINWIVYILLLNAQLGFGQEGFVKIFDNEDFQQSNFLDVVIDDNTIITYGIAKEEGFQFIKMDTLGTILDTQIIEDTEIGSAYNQRKIIKTMDGGYAVCGISQGETPTVFLLKVAPDFSLVFLKKYESDYPTSNASLVETPSGFLVVANQISNNNFDIVLIKTDKNGIALSRKELYLPYLDEFAFSIKKANNNLFYITGARADINGVNQSPISNGIIIQADSSANMNFIWESDTTLGVIWDFVILEDGSWLCASSTWEYNDDQEQYLSRPLIYKLDSNQNLLWNKTFFTPKPIQGFRNILATPDGNFLASGNIKNGKTIHYKFSAQGDSIWFRVDQANQYQTAISGTTILPSGSIVSVGTIFNDLNIRYPFAIKINQNGCILPDCWTTTSSLNIPSSKAHVAPNPAQASISFAYDDWPTNTKIIIYNSLGQAIESFFPQGNRYTLSTTNYPSGHYYYQIISPHPFQNGQFIIIR